MRRIRAAAAATLMTAGWPSLTVPALAPGMLIYGVGQGAIAPTLFRVILSGVPAESAGVGSGVLTTTQQTSIALGIATIGSLSAALAVPLGMRTALLVATALLLAIPAGIAALSTRLPDPR